MFTRFEDDEGLATCPGCDGRGRVRDKICITCRGEGMIDSEEAEVIDEWKEEDQDETGND